MKRLLVVRPQPGADATAERARTIGLQPMVVPLFEVRAVEWAPPDPDGFDAILVTSANALRCGGGALTRYFGLPLFAVGNATAQAAREAGFADIVTGQGDGTAIVAMAVAQGRTRLLRLAARDHVDLDGLGASIERCIVYASEPIENLPGPAADALRKGVVVLLHSARAATLFGQLVDAAGIDRGKIGIAGLSKAVIAAAGGGWARSVAASVPEDEALLAIAAGLCDHDANGPD